MTYDLRQFAVHGGSGGSGGGGGGGGGGGEAPWYSCSI